MGRDYSAGRMGLLHFSEEMNTRSMTFENLLDRESGYQEIRGQETRYQDIREKQDKKCLT